MKTANPAPVELARELDALHQLLYTRGGIRPSNAAVEELAKLLLLRIASVRQPRVRVAELGVLEELMSPERLALEDGVRVAKEAFGVANALPELGAVLPDGSTQSVWPLDEPLRISRNDVLSEAVRILWKLEMGGVGSYDPIGTAFDVFLRGRYEHAGGLGTYLTPEGIVSLMVSTGFDLLEGAAPSGNPPALMGDPCCGSGRFLVGLLHEARRRGLDQGQLENGAALFGADQSTSSVAMARVNLMAAGIQTPEVFAVQDSIVDPWVRACAGRFSLILTNPPFGEGKYDSSEGIDRAATVLPRLAGASRIDPALGFVSLCVDLLQPGGVAGIILPDGVGDGPSMRELLLRPPSAGPEVRVEGVVSLPSATFAPAGTTAKTSIVFLRRSRRDEDKPVFFARADHVGYKMSNGVCAADPAGDDLPEIGHEIHRFAKSATSGAEHSERLVTRSLRAVTSLDASAVDRGADSARMTLKEAGGLEARTILRYSGKRRSPVLGDTAFVSVLHVDELGAVDWAAAASHRPSTPGQVAEPGELIVSLLNPSKFRAAVIPPDQGTVQCSAEFGVFQPGIDAHAALTLLQHPLVRRQIAPLGRGTSSSRRRIDAEDVMSLVLPGFEDEWAVRAGRRAAEDFAAISAARQSLRSLYEDLLELEI